MKKSILMLIVLTMLSCGYNIKTDRELVVEANRIVQAQEEVTKVKEQWKQFKDSVVIVALKEERFKDSVEFTNLSRTMCYDRNKHRHSCEIYK